MPSCLAAAAASPASSPCRLLLMLLVLLTPMLQLNLAASDIDARFGETLAAIAARSPYKFVREAILAAAGETKAILCSFDSEFSVSEGWRSTFYSPVSWYVFNPRVGREVPLDSGAAVSQGSTGPRFKYRITDVRAAVPTSLLVMEKVAQHLSGNYYICRTSLRPSSVQAFYLKVIEPVLLLLRPATSRMAAAIGGRLRLRCRSGNSFPPASVHWTRRRRHRAAAEPQVLAWGPIMEIAAVTVDTADYVYTCHTNNNVDPERSASFEVQLTSGSRVGPASIAATYNGVQAAFRHASRQAKPQYLRTFTASCRARGNDLTFKWYRNSTQLAQFGDPNLYMFTTAAGEFTVSDLIVRKFRLQDRGVYECEATNRGGSRKFAFYLDEIRDLPSQLSPSTEAPASNLHSWQSRQSGSGWQQHYGDYGGSGDGYGDDFALDAGGEISGEGEPAVGEWRQRRVI